MNNMQFLPVGAPSVAPIAAPTVVPTIAPPAMAPTMPPSHEPNFGNYLPMPVLMGDARAPWQVPTEVQGDFHLVNQWPHQAVAGNVIGSTSCSIVGPSMLS